MFSAPILLAATAVSFMAFGAVAGAAWLFVAGDNPWPSSVNAILIVVFVLTFAASTLILARRAYAFGKTQEARASTNPLHAAASLAATVFLLLLIVYYEWHVGNIGAKADGVLCSEFCLDKGFAASGMPPRNEGAAACICFDPQGREATNVPMDTVRSRQ